MIPKSLSATAIQTADFCLSRFEAEHVLRGRGFANTAASLGTSCHDALENYVKLVYLLKTQAPDLKLLLDLFRMAYMKTFGTSDCDTEDFKDGEKMLKAWFKRTDFSGVTVLSCEVKESFPLTTSVGPIPFNFIWDRHDQVAETEYKVVDYKTNRWGLRPEDLRRKVQARTYGLVAQIKHPEATKIWVEFDMLRHDGPVGTVFTKEENAATWRFLKETAERIINTAEGHAPETLNPECNFCVRKTSCSVLQKNIAAGGIMGIKSAKDAVDLRAVLEYQLKAVSSAITELDTMILAEAKKDDVFNFESDMYELSIGVSSKRTVDAERAAFVLGPALMDKYAGKSLTIATVEKLLAGDELTESQKKQLGSLIYKRVGEPRVKVNAKSVID